MSIPVIETVGLTRRFGDLIAVDHLTISVQAGEAFGLLGPNGAGKTTAIKMLITLLPPTSGEARVAGFSITRRPSDVRRVTGYVPQLISADSTLTGYENLMIFAKLYDVPRTERKRRVMEGLSFMGLDEAANKLVRTYSGGMIRRLEIIQSIVHRPQVLFLDEPTVGLDPLARKSLWEHISQLRAEHGTTIFLTTHLMEEADHLCTRVAIMHRGKLAALGTPADLKAAIGSNGVTLEDVFIHYAGDKLEPESGANYRETSRTRRTATRLG
ncbi:MAG: ATP-binding cassette domain-containing protein [Chloroflexi bacterium]|nr:ATP-binding cassette domain-containing protein [Chloroflexota bacterium]